MYSDWMFGVILFLLHTKLAHVSIKVNAIIHVIMFISVSEAVKANLDTLACGLTYSKHIYELSVSLVITFD